MSKDRWSIIDILLSEVSTIGNIQQALVLISLIAIITMVDSQFINVFYRLVCESLTIYICLYLCYSLSSAL